jgi:hypothetical protein
MVWPVIHQPSETRKRMKGTMSSMSVRPVLEKFDRAEIEQCLLDGQHEKGSDF